MGNEILAPYYREAIGLLRYFKALKLMHTPREFNKEADALCKQKLAEFIAIK